MKRVVIGLALSSICLAAEARQVETLSPLVSDKLGEESIIEMRDQLERVRAQYAGLAALIKSKELEIATEVGRFDELINKRSSEIDSIKRVNAYKYYTVQPNSFRLELGLFARRLGIQTIRWSSDIPECLDWRFDSTFQIDITNPNRAVNEFFDGLPLMPKRYTKDSSLNISATEVMHGCN
ncbi:hypothetical protein [Shewanella sp. MBTL60-007]|uniref:hypothetical protein n=1 Tax=Shewanella sp. MBTL60-007 TaxID=2815911 RepID=UPI001BC625F3|nr:hypothetical protein [Shewanella sp. MBTL60-007]GIU20953.1 hypothetical protein TUM3792_21230 [Shewanella sp. MBTL60-007]